MTTETPAPPLMRDGDFRRRTLAALETHQGTDYHAMVVNLHESTLRRVQEENQQAQHVAHESIAQMATSAMLENQMLSEVLRLVQPIVRSGGEAATRAALRLRTLDAVDRLLRQAEQESRSITPDELRAVLGSHADTVPFRPRSLGFVPSRDYRMGVFTSAAGDRTLYLPFAGYVVCEESEGQLPAVHVAFMYDGVVKGRPQLYAEYGFVFKQVE